METGLCILLTFLLQQIADGGGHDGGRADGCVPGFQVRNYQLVLGGPLQKGQPLLQVEFDDCAGNEDVSFEVSDPSFHVDGDLNLVPRRDVESCGPVLLVHGFGSHVDDRAQVDVSGLPVRSENTLTVSDFGSVLPL
ncbi:cadherin-13-like isoform X1 [Poecilia formosa]|uniref:cadherin-13-like isoform X1 n=1 Tax=Poecilia formosa TaxID=48698 RepID=UPI0007B7CE26|nr:PREDICTED: cadherin-13-like isoform X1 [Poecilia formosa]